MPTPEYEIEYDEYWDGTNGIATIVKTSAASGSNTSYIREAYADFVKLGTLAFGVNEVDNFSFIYRLKMTNLYGREVFDHGIIITMPKEEFVRFNWKAFDHKPIDRQLKLTCSEYFIHPSLLKGVKKEDLWLSY